MDPIAVLQNRIEQLEAKLGLAAGVASLPLVDPIHGDSINSNLLNTAQQMNDATAGMEKLPQAMAMANELNNYTGHIIHQCTDPNLVENMQQNQMNMQEVAAAESAIRHHCHCVHQCQQRAPVMESEPILQVPEMQAQVDQMYAAATEVKQEADAVSQGVQELAETCGAAAMQASDDVASIASKVERVEEIILPKKRNGLD